MKKAILIAICLSLALSGCSGSKATTSTTPVVTSTFETTTEPPPVPDDIEIVTAQGHPKLYSSLKEAEKVWEDVAKDKINYGGRYKDQTVISLEDYGKDVIQEIEVYFSNFNKGPEVTTVPEAVSLAYEYIPENLLGEYYDLQDAYIVKPKEDEKDSQKEIVYVINYRKNDAGDGYVGEGRINIHLYCSLDNIPQSIGIGSKTPKWINYLDTNGYERHEWDQEIYLLPIVSEGE